MKKTARTRLSGERRRRGWSQQEVADHLGTTRNNVSRWENGQTTPSPYFRAKLCELFGMPAYELGLLGTNPSPSAEGTAEETARTSAVSAELLALWTVPYQRNPHFTGREELLEQLDQQFSALGNNSAQPRRAALTQPQAIKGLGGIGKTQIAVEYAYRAREQNRYTHILWINAASEEAIMSSFAALAELLPAVAATKEPDHRQMAAAIIHWLEQHKERWLLIFDNADDIALIQSYLPHQGNGSLLFTTRAHAVGAFAMPIDVETMGLVEGTTLLLRRTRRQQASDDERNEATNIVIALDGFPLALDQAGAYIEETGCDFRDYLQIYQEHRQALLARRGRQGTHYPDSVATTWLLSFQKIEQADSATAELLHLCAFLAPDAIPEELLTGEAAQWPVALQQAVTNRLAFNHLLEALLRFSLIKRHVEERTLSLHRLVQGVQRDMMGQEKQREWAMRVVRALHGVFPSDPKGDVASWPQCLRYLEQAQACNVLILQYQLQLPQAAELLNRVGTYLYENASYTLAEPLYLQALAIWEQQGAQENVHMASSLQGLAELYLEQGKCEQAEVLYQRALAIWEQQLGPEHPALADALHGLATIFYTIHNKYEQAESLYLRAVRLQEQALGETHPKVAQSLGKLAILYIRWGKYEQAEKHLQRAVTIQEQTLGANHLQVISSLHGLAQVYKQWGKYEQAELFYQRVLQIREQVLGPDHPEVAVILNNLANLYQDQEKYEQAEALYQRSVFIWEQAMGPEHYNVAHSLDNLSINAMKQGHHEQAEVLQQRALRIREETLGPESVQVGYSLHGLADLYRIQEKYEQAKLLYQRVLHIWERTLGPEHPYMAAPLNGLANLSSKLGINQQATSLFQQALSIRERTLGEHNLDTAITLYDFAAFQETQHEYQEAASLYQRAFAIREQVLGAEHPTTIATRTAYLAQRRTLHCAEEAASVERALVEEDSSYQP